MIKEFVQEQKEKFKKEFAIGAFKFAIVQVGNNEASNRYVRNKVKDCEEVGIIAHVYGFEENVAQEDLEWDIGELNRFYDAIMIQLPLPKHLNKDKLVERISPEKDVDGMRKDSIFKCCTPSGIIDYLEWRNVDIEGSNAVVIGRSDIVGKPMAQYLLEKNATVTVCHSKSKNIDYYLRNADIIVCAVGKEKFLDCSGLKGIVIDVGINFNAEGKLVGDCWNTEGVDVTPVPGGVGLLTRCALLKNLFLAKIYKEIE